MNEPYWQFVTEEYRGARRCSASYILQVSGRLFRQLRREFTWRLARALGKRAEQMRRPVVTVWYDAFGRIGNAQVIPYMAPQGYDTDIPLIPRIAVNTYAVRVTRARVGRLGCPRDRVPEPAMDRPRLELSATPEELLDFVPWVVNLIEHHERGTPLSEPPHACDTRGLAMHDACYVWTCKARDEAEAHERARESLRQETQEGKDGAT